MTMVTLPGLHHRDDDYDLDPAVLEALWAMEEQHFWHDARARFILRALGRLRVAAPARILEVGCGAGSVASMLHARGYRVTGIDTAVALVAKAHARCPDATFIAGTLEALPPSGRPFEAIGFFDVLEHLDEPERLLTTAMSHAGPGSAIIATVPAMQALYSAVDYVAGHKRRYENGELGSLFARSGLVEIEERAIFRTMLPLMRLRRKPVSNVDGAALDREARRRIMLDDMRIPLGPVNFALRLISRLEAYLGFAGARDKVGPTILVTARLPS